MAYKLNLAEMEHRHGAIWRFNTARYTVACWAENEDASPEDSFCDDRDIAFASSGDPAHWFCAFVGVFYNPYSDGSAGDELDEDLELIAYDVLGGCSYNSFHEFVSSHRDPDPANRNCAETNKTVRICHYFPSMVRSAVREAKGVIALRREGVAA